MRHGWLIGFALLLVAAPLPVGAQEDAKVVVRRMVLAETSLAPGAQQLLQVTLANTGRAAVAAGLQADLRDDRDRRIGSPQRRRVQLAAKDESRFLFKFRVPSRSGQFALRFEVLTPDFKRKLIPGGPVFFSPFVAGDAAPRPSRISAARQARIAPPSFLPPGGLAFERPDLLWENLSVSPQSLLLREPLVIKADLRNVGGDIARDVTVRVAYFNTRTPSRLQDISTSKVEVLAPGEKLEMEFETKLPDDALLGEYRVSLRADTLDTVEELDEGNNTVTTAAIRLSRIKLVFPEPGFAFEEAGLFLFRWDSLRFDEFKVQVGTDPAFADESQFFDLPQGDKWTQEKEIVPLEGELPAMALALSDRVGSKSLYWRVVGRDTKSDLQGFSTIHPFTITPEERPQQQPPPSEAPSAPQAPAAQ